MVAIWWPETSFAELPPLTRKFAERGDAAPCTPWLGLAEGRVCAKHRTRRPVVSPRPSNTLAPARVCSQVLSASLHKWLPVHVYMV